MLIVRAVGLLGVQPKEAGGDQGVGVVRLQFVAGQLLAQEAIVGQIVVEGADDVIAVAIGVGPQLVELEALRLGVAHHVEPVLRPALAEVRRAEQTIDHRS